MEKTKKYSLAYEQHKSFRGGCRAAETSKMERFVIIVNGFQPFTIITKYTILDIAAFLNPPLSLTSKKLFSLQKTSS